VTTTLSSKGQVVIPLDIRTRLGLLPGALIDCKLEEGRIILTPVVPSGHARIIAQQDYVALDAPDGAPVMTPGRVKAILSEP
jgi:AbrB family looped-hinge helix DNA binding protein